MEYHLMAVINKLKYALLDYLSNTNRLSEKHTHLPVTRRKTALV